MIVNVITTVSRAAVNTKTSVAKLVRKMHVSFSFYFNFNIATKFLYEQNIFFLRTQAFASPTDMTSSGVRENVNLTITPTLDGVCGMLLYIILIFCFIAKLNIYQYF